MTTLDELAQQQQEQATFLDSLARSISSLQRAAEVSSLSARLEPGIPMRMGAVPSGADVYPAGSTEPGAAAVIAHNAVTSDSIAPGAVTGTAFADSIRPVAIVTALPSLPDALYPADSYVVLSTTHRLYKNVSGAWALGVDGADIVADSITAGQLAVGAVSASEIAANAVTATAIAAGSVTADKLLVGDMSNLITNPGFETGDLTGWAAGGTGTVAVTTNPHSGKYRCDITNGASGVTYVTSYPAYIPVGAGEVLSYGLWNVVQSGGGASRIAIECYDAALSSTGEVTASLTASSAWHHDSGTLTTPASTAFVRVRVYSDTASKIVAFDDLVLMRGGVVIDSSGITVRNGAITIANAGGTVIIDGTSDMFKIRATGTMTLTGPVAGAQATTYTDLSLGLTYRPAHHGYLEAGGTPLRGEILPRIVADYNGTAHVLDDIRQVIQVIGTDTTRVNLVWEATVDRTTLTYTGRYYVMTEAAV